MCCYLHLRLKTNQSYVNVPQLNFVKPFFSGWVTNYCFFFFFLQYYLCPSHNPTFFVFLAGELIKDRTEDNITEPGGVT